MRRATIFRMLAPMSQLVAKQLSHPTGWLGRTVMTRVLNRGNRELIMTTLENLVPSADMRLLDVGFGGGLALRVARERGVNRLVGIDPSLAAVEELRKTSKRWTRGAELTLEQGTVEHLPLADSAVDAIISTNTVYFWPDLARAFHDLYRVLKPHGRLVLGFSSCQKLRSFETVTRHGFLFYEAAELVEQARRAGFSDVQLIQLNGRNTAGDYNLIATKGDPHASEANAIGRQFR